MFSQPLFVRSFVCSLPSLAMIHGHALTNLFELFPFCDLTHTHTHRHDIPQRTSPTNFHRLPSGQKKNLFPQINHMVFAPCMCVCTRCENYKQEYNLLLPFRPLYCNCADARMNAPVSIALSTLFSIRSVFSFSFVFFSFFFKFYIFIAFGIEWAHRQ